MRVCALACVPVRPPPEGTLYVIAKGGGIEPLVSLLLAVPFGLRKGKWFSLSNLQVSVSVWLFRRTNFV